MVETMKSERKRVTFAGRTNVGKSSLINALLGQELSIVSPLPGTTTDPTEKAIEILPAGPLLFTDTAGIDDFTPLREQRLRKVKDVLRKTDLLVIVLDPNITDFVYERELITFAQKRSIPYIFVVNKIDMFDRGHLNIEFSDQDKVFFVSAIKKTGIDELRGYIGQILADKEEKGILEGIVKKDNHILCITPVHPAYPKGRLKPLQVQVFREILDRGAYFTVIKPEHIKSSQFIIDLKPDLIILDAQAIKIVKDFLPESIPVTSFSMLFANYKGSLSGFIEGLESIYKLQDGDRVAIVEACTHHRLEGDMGKEIIPDILRLLTDKKLEFLHFSGVHQDFSEIDNVKLALHCGGCMLTKRDMESRKKIFSEKRIPLLNYGVLIAHYQGVLERFAKPLLKVAV